jgi:hypothetical protein
MLAEEALWKVKGMSVIGKSMYMSRLSEEWRHLPVSGSVLHVKVCTFRGVSDDLRRLRSNCVLFQQITCTLAQTISRLPLLNHSTLGRICRNICRLFLTSYLCKTNAKLKAIISGREPTWCTTFHRFIYSIFQLSTCFGHIVPIFRRDKIVLTQLL